MHASNIFPYTPLDNHTDTSSNVFAQKSMLEFTLLIMIIVTKLNRKGRTYYLISVQKKVTVYIFLNKKQDFTSWNKCITLVRGGWDHASVGTEKKWEVSVPSSWAGKISLAPQGLSGWTKNKTDMRQTWGRRKSNLIVYVREST